MSNPTHPVYIISKGRWESRMTSIALEEMKVPYRIVIEPQEYEKYASVIDPKKILQLPFSNLGQGSIPARNFVWEHSISEGHKWHWILDDNITKFWRLNNNYRYPVKTGSIFKAGYCTVLFYAFLAQKMPTLTMKGGNTDELYAGVNSGNKEEDGRYKMAKSLVDQHPEICKVSWKWNRHQHHVDYRRFKMNKLKLKPGVIIPKGINEYGMVLKDAV